MLIAIFAKKCQILPKMADFSLLAVSKSAPLHTRNLATPSHERGRVPETLDSDQSVDLDMGHKGTLTMRELEMACIPSPCVDMVPTVFVSEGQSSEESLRHLRCRPLRSVCPSDK